MNNYSSLKATINANVKQNGNQEITGAIMNSVLNAMVDSLGAGYQYKGVATPATNPGTPDYNVFYLASEAGTYTNFGGIVIGDNEVAALVYNGSWSKQTTGAATASEVSQLAQKVSKITIPVSGEGSYINLSGGVGTTIPAPTTASAWEYFRFPVVPGDIIIVNGQGGSSPRLWGFVDSDEKIVSVSDASITGTDLRLVAPINAAEVIINCNRSYSGSKISYYISKDCLLLHLDEMDAEIDILSADVEKINYSVLQLWRRSDISVFSERERYNIGTGTLITGGNYYTTPFILLKDLAGAKLSYNFSSSASANAITLFNSSKEYIANVQDTSAVDIDSLISTYPTAVYVRLSIFNTNFSTFKVYTSNVEMYTQIQSVKESINNALPVQKSAKIFRRVGCIGDSYTAGYIQIVSPPLPDNTYPLWSWPHYMKQLTGEVWENWGKGGSTAKGWVEGAANLNLVQAEGNKCQAYIIGLGINDKNSSNPYYTPVGLVGDIGTDNDTYYAYYYKLIKAVVAVNSEAKIFCNTCPKSKTDAVYIPYNQAVRDIVEYCHDTENLNVYLCDLADDKYNNSAVFDNTIYTRELINGHYTPIGYEFMAECMLYVLSDVVNENYSEMMNVFEVPYDTPE